MKNKGKLGFDQKSHKGPKAVMPKHTAKKVNKPMAKMSKGIPKIAPKFKGSNIMDQVQAYRKKNYGA